MGTLLSPAVFCEVEYWYMLWWKLLFPDRIMTLKSVCIATTLLIHWEVVSYFWWAQAALAVGQLAWLRTFWCRIWLKLRDKSEMIKKEKDYLIFFLFSEKPACSHVSWYLFLNSLLISQTCSLSLNIPYMV